MNFDPGFAESKVLAVCTNFTKNRPTSKVKQNTKQRQSIPLYQIVTQKATPPLSNLYRFLLSNKFNKAFILFLIQYIF